jgi:ATP-dependent helicase STH1/SNF2
MDLLRIYTSLHQPTGSYNSNQMSPLGQQRPMTLTADQAKLAKYQGLAYKYVSRNMPVPAQLQETIDSLLNAKGSQVTGQAVRAVSDAASAKVDQDLAEAKTGLLSSQRILVPGINPIGLDPMSLVEEREKRVRACITARITELENIVNELPLGSVDLGLIAGNQKATKIKALIELKSLRLLEKQKLLRQEIVSGMKRSTVVPTAVSRADYRRIKKPTVREIRLTERMEKQQRLEREKKEKQKHYEYLNTIIAHGRDMMLSCRNLAQKQMKLGRAVLHWHANIEKEELKRQEQNTKDRIKALKVIKAVYMMLMFCRPMTKKRT